MQKHILFTIALTALTSGLISLMVNIYYPRAKSPGVIKETQSVISAIRSASPGASLSSDDGHFAEYETIINTFLDTIRKGNIEAAYTSTSPIFQKLTSLDSFRKLAADFTSNQNIPSIPCTLTEYSEPFSSTIKGLTETFMITQTKCEANEGGDMKGFNVEFIKDQGTSKISYINVYKGAVVHKR